jgi:hypothetical protein
MTINNKLIFILTEDENFKTFSAINFVAYDPG